MVDLTEEEASLRKHIQKNPKDGEAYDRLGQIYLIQDKFAEALDLFRQAVSVNPTYLDAHIHLSMTLERLNRLDAALETLQAARAHFPNEANLIFFIGNLLLKQGAWDKAEQAFLETLRIQPNHAFAYVNLGIIELHHHDDIQAAIETLKKAVELAPDEALTHYYLGDTLLRANQLGQAESELRKAIERDPDDAKAHIRLGITCFQQGRDNEATIEFLKATRLDPDNAEAHFRLGFMFHQAGKLSGAIESYQTVFQLKPDLFVIHLLLANIYAQQEAYEKVIEELIEVLIYNFERYFTIALEENTQFRPPFQKQTSQDHKENTEEALLGDSQDELIEKLEAQSNSVGAHTILALLAIEAEDFKRAEIESQKAMDLNPKDPFAHFLMGLLAMNREELTIALEHFQQTISLKPDFTPAHLTQGWIYEHTGQMSNAILQYTHALQKESEWLQLHVGNLLIQEKRFDEAIIEFQKMLQKNPQHPEALWMTGYVLFRQSKTPQAIQILEAAFQSYPDHPQTCFLLGNLYANEHYPSNATEIFKHCLSLNLTDFDPDVLYKNWEDIDKIDAALDMAAQQSLDTSKSYLILAEIYQTQGKLDKSVEILKTALAKKTDDPLLYSRLGNLLMKLKRPEESRVAYQNALNIDATYIWAKRGIGWSYYQEKDWENAERAFLQVIEQKPDAAAYNGLGEVYRNQERYQEAKTAYLNAIELTPDFQPAYFNFGRMSRDHGNYRESIETFQAYLEKYADDIEARFQLGLSYFYARSHKEAVSEWQKVLIYENRRKGYVEILTYLALQHMGLNDQAERLIQKEVLALKPNPSWPAPIMAFLAGQISDTELFEAAKDADEQKEKENLCEVYYYLGAWYHLVKHDLKTAQHYFQQALDTQITEFIEYRLAQFELQRPGNSKTE